METSSSAISTTLFGPVARAIKRRRIEDEGTTRSERRSVYRFQRGVVWVIGLEESIVRARIQVGADAPALLVTSTENVSIWEVVVQSHMVASRRVAPGAEKMGEVS